MTPQLQQKLIHALVQTGDLASAQEAGVTVDWLDDLQAKSAYQAILDYSNNPRTAGQVPGYSYLVQRLASVPGAYDGEESLPQILEAVRTARMIQLNGKALHAALTLNTTDPIAARNGLIEALTSREIEALTTAGREVSLGDLIPGLFQHYAESMAAAGVTGVPTPFEALTNSTKGWQRGDLYTVYAGAGSYKCLPAATRVMQRDGTFVPIADVPLSCEVPSFTRDTGRTRWAPARKIFSGLKDCVEVLLTTGRRIVVGADHPMMTPGFLFRQAQELRAGDRVAISNNLPEAEETGEISVEDAHLLGLLVGDGGLTKGVTFTKDEPTVIASVARHAERWGLHMRQAVGDGLTWYLTADRGQENPLINFIRALGLFGTKSTQKFIPDAVFRAGRRQIAAFVAGLFDTDGCVSGNVASWATSSRRLVDDLLHAFSRLGFRASMRDISDVAYQLTINDSTGQRRLIDTLGEFCANAPRMEKLRQAASRRSDDRSGRLPLAGRLIEVILRDGAGRGWPAGTRQSDFVGPGLVTVGRDKVSSIAEAWESTELRDWTRGDLRYESVKSVTPVGQRVCWDLVIEDGEDPNFLAGCDFVVHNSWCMLSFALQALRSSDGNVLVVTSEMPSEQLAVRFLCLTNGWNFNDYRDRALSLNRVSAMLSQEYRDRVHFHQPTGFDIQAIAEVRNRIKRLNMRGGVSLVLWDGHYRSASKQDWEYIYDLTRKTRMLALEKEILQPPIIVATQEGSEKGKATHAVYKQESSLMMFLTKTAHGRILMQTTKVREGPSVEIDIDVNLKSGIISQISAKSEADGHSTGAGGIV